MDQGIDRLCDNHDPKVHIRGALVLHDLNGEQQWPVEGWTALTSLNSAMQLNFWSFAVMFVLSAIALNYWIRFRYLNDYTQLKEPPLVKPDVNELHPDVNTGA